jgi:hypothetical protein
MSTSERETKNHQIGSHSYVVKTYATAREVNDIQQIYFKGTKVEVLGREPKINEFNPNVQFEMEQAMIREMVVSMDGSEENIVERCTDLPFTEYRDLISLIDDLVSKKKN